MRFLTLSPVSTEGPMVEYRADCLEGGGGKTFAEDLLLEEDLIFEIQSVSGFLLKL